MVKEIERTYGPKKITPNLHLCMHLCECMLDYGPLYAFWCYSMERMNGLLGNHLFNIIIRYQHLLTIKYFFLGSFHSSNRRIEPELMKIIQNNALLNELTS